MSQIWDNILYIFKGPEGSKAKSQKPLPADQLFHSSSHEEERLDEQLLTLTLANNIVQYRIIMQ